MSFITSRMGITVASRYHRLVRLNTTSRHTTQIIQNIRRGRPHTQNSHINRLLRVSKRVIRPRLRVRTSATNRFRQKFMTIMTQVGGSSFITKLSGHLGHTRSHLNNTKNSNCFIVNVSVSTVTTDSFHHRLLTRRQRTNRQQVLIITLNSILTSHVTRNLQNVRVKGTLKRVSHPDLHHRLERLHRSDSTSVQRLANSRQ